MFDYSLPNAADALLVAERLQAAGFTAYFAGGCVRDALLGRVPKDFDVATDATPDKVRDVFGKRQTLAFGVSFGVIGVLGQSSAPTEVATFRSDGEYSDGRRPDSVRFGNAQDDAQRRDFTINGMFYDPVRKQVIDYVGGQKDLGLRRIRAIGHAAQRIAEDKLRMLRAIRFAATLQFDIESTTLNAIQETADALHAVSGERIGAELRRMFSQSQINDSADPVKSNRSGYAWRLLIQSRLLPSLWPQIAQAVQDDQLLIERGAVVLGPIEPPSFVVALACLIIEADLRCEQAIEQLTQRWKLSCDEQRAIVACVKDCSVVQAAHCLPWSQVQPVLISRDAAEVLATAVALAVAHDRPFTGIHLCRSKLADPLEVLNPAPLVTGDQLKQLGYPPGPRFREVLQTIRQEQLDGILHGHEQALERVKQVMKT